MLEITHAKITEIHKHTQTHRHTHTHTHTHADAHTHMHIHTCTHIHTYYFHCTNASAAITSSTTSASTCTNSACTSIRRYMGHWFGHVHSIQLSHLCCDSTGEALTPPPPTIQDFAGAPTPEHRLKFQLFYKSCRYWSETACEIIAGGQPHCRRHSMGLLDATANIACKTK